MISKIHRAINELVISCFIPSSAKGSLIMNQRTYNALADEMDSTRRFRLSPKGRESIQYHHAVGEFLSHINESIIDDRIVVSINGQTKVINTNKWPTELRYITTLGEERSIKTDNPLEVRILVKHLQSLLKVHDEL